MLIVGASLLAKAVGQSTLVLADLALSRAGSLPHLFWGVVGIEGGPQKLWEPALLAMAVGQVMMMLAGLA